MTPHQTGEMHIVGLAFNLGSSSVGQQQQINQTQVCQSCPVTKCEEHKTLVDNISDRSMTYKYTIISGVFTALELQSFPLALGSLGWSIIFLR